MFGLTWLHPRMSYHCFMNLRELLHGDLSKKINTGIKSKDFENKPCNCSTNSTSEGTCMYNGMCRQYCIMYKVTCKLCNAVYIGNTQQSFKEQINGHFSDVQNLIMNGTVSDSFAKHFAKHFDSKPSCKTLHDNMEFKIVSKLNPIGVMKTFTLRNCSLCMNECLTILKWMWKKPKLMINTCFKIYGACRHRMKFHRFVWH